MYHKIDETAARRAHDANSYRTFVEGRQTAAYREAVDKAAEIAESQKSHVDPMHHEKIDGLLAAYSRKLADHINRGFEIEARVPSIMVAGGSNFPVRAKEKQNAARDRHMQNYREIEGLLDKIRATGMGGISSDDPAAIEKLREKLAGLENSQQRMKDVNAYFKKHGSLEGCTLLPTDTIREIAAYISRYSYHKRPFESYSLSNNSANIRRVKERIAQLERSAEKAAAAAELPEGEFDGWDFNGGRVLRNHPENRLQILFDDKPEQATRTELKAYGFRWSPKQSAWQRILSSAAERDARIVLKALLKGE